MDKKNLKYFAAACFAVLAFPYIKSIFAGFSVKIFIMLAVYIIIIVALLTDRPILSVIGFIVLAIQTAYDYCLVDLLKSLLKGNLFYRALLYPVLLLTVNLSLAIASIHPKSAKRLGIIAASAAFIRFVLTWGAVGDDMSATVAVRMLVPAAGAVLLGLAYDNMAKEKVALQTNTSKIVNNPASGTLENDNIEKIMRLKSFLDEGVITQEEFDAKKKQILGM